MKKFEYPYHTKNRVISVVFLILFVLLSSTASYSKTLVVDENAECLTHICITCEGMSLYGYKTIQDALNAANNGDTIDVCPGTYNESLIWTKKNITLEGTSGNRDDVLITQQNAKTISFSNWPQSVTIKNVTIESKQDDAIYVDSEPPSSALFENVSIKAGKNGIKAELYISNFHLKDSDIESKTRRGIYFEGNTNQQFFIENSSIKSKKEGIKVTNINNGTEIKGSNIASQREEAVGIDGSLNGGLEVTDTTLEGKRGFYVTDNLSGSKALFDNVTIQSSDQGIQIEGTLSPQLQCRDLHITADGKAIDVGGSLNGGLDIQNSRLTSQSDRGIYVGNTVNNGITINATHIDAKDDGLQVEKDISGDIVIEKSEVNSTNARALYFKQNINNKLTIEQSTLLSYDESIKVEGNVNQGILINESNLTSNNDDGVEIGGDIYGNIDNGKYDLVIKSSNIKAKKRALNLYKGKQIDAKFENSYFESSSDDTVKLKLTDWKSILATGNCFKAHGSGDYAFYLNMNNSNDVHINSNCFYASAVDKEAKSTGKGYDWEGNYWDGLSGNKYDYNNVVDNNSLSSCPNSCEENIIPKPIADYRMDECSWSGAIGEVKDSSGNGHDGSAKNGATTDIGKICRAGKFGGDSYVVVPHSPDLSLKNNFTYMAWIKLRDPNQVTNSDNLENIFTNQSWTNALRFTEKGYWHRGDKGQRILFQLKIGRRVRYLFSKTRINDTNWHYIAGVYNGYRMIIYIDGNPDNSKRIRQGNVKVGTGDNIIGGEYGEYYFNGWIDELKIFNIALTHEQIQQIYNNENEGKNYDGSTRTCPVCAVINHYEIWHYPTNLTCQSAPIEIKACANDNCSTLYTDNVSLSLNYDGDNKQLNFSGGEDNTTISYTQAGTITLSTNNESPAPADNTTCHIFNSSSTSCDITFKDTGFVFKTPTNSNYVVNNILSCSPKSIEIDAVQKDNVTNKCTNMSVFNGDVTLNMYGRYITPSTNPYGTKVMVDNTSVETVDNGSTTAGTSITLHFDNGTSQFNLSYPDAGSIEVGAICSNNNGLAVSGESNPFVVKPARLVFDNLSSPADNSSCTTNSCWADIGIFKKAGEEFDFNVKAVCDNGSVTPNYYPIDENGDNSTIGLSASMVAPDNGTDVTSKLDNTTIYAKDFSGGLAPVKERFNEVGIISMNATDSNYLGAGSINGNVPYVGRFIPDHFKITKIDNGTLDEQCDTFNYTGSMTTYNAHPAFVITARNRDNITTKNYKGDFFKLSTDNISILSPATDDKQLGKDAQNKVDLSVVRAKAILTDNNNGSGTYTFGNDNITYIKDNNSEIAPFSPQFSFVIDNITDSDKVSCIDLPDNITVNGLDMKYGRLKIFDNYGPETEDLKMSVETQFWDGQYWKTNEDDSCTALAKDDFILSNFTGNLSSGETYIIDNSTNGISNGKGYFVLKAPGENNYGTADVCLSDNASFYSYLNDTSTCGVATFGIYRGRDRIIEWKEIPAQ